jgi:hypothetical protein
VMDDTLHPNATGYGDREGVVANAVARILA